MADAVFDSGSAAQATAGATAPAAVDAAVVTESNTPLGLAQDVLQLVVTAATVLDATLPTIQWAQLGTPVMTCSSVAVGVMSTREVALYDGKIQCGALLQADITVGIARDCSIEHDQDGNTDPAKVGAIALLMDLDSQVLTAASEMMEGRTTGATIQYNVEGGLAVTNLIISSEVVVW